MNQSESTSDTDSSVSSWIFVDDLSDSETEKNKYYLNCSTEPIQELTQQCINSRSGEQETDSDGISIISESDDIKEQLPNEEQPVSQDNAIVTEPVEVVTLCEKNEKNINKDEYYFNKYFVVGWVLLAIITPILLNYFAATYKHKDGSNFKSVDKRITKENMNGYLNALESAEEEVTSPSNEGVVRKHESKGEIDIHRLEYNMKGINNKKERKNEIKLNKKIKISDKSEEIVKNKKGLKLKSEKIFKDYNKKDKKKKRKSEENKFENIENKPNDTKEYDKQIKRLKKSLRKKDRELKELAKLLKLKDKQLKFLEFKILKELNVIRKGDSYEYPKNFMNPAFSNGKINNTLGDWYGKLHKGRSLFRNQQHASDWVFDRADFRNRKRNKRNEWYWNWMTEREQLRLKKGSWVFLY